jgi:hypothetical protein
LSNPRRTATEGSGPRTDGGTEEPVYISIRHQEWAACEMEFVGKQSKKGLPDRHPHAIDEQEMADYAVRLGNADTRDPTIYELIEKVGPEVLWVAGPGPAGPIVRGLIQERVRGAYHATRISDTVEERATAALFLHSLCNALAGDRRGRRQHPVRDPLAVRSLYYRTLFRLRRARALLQNRELLCWLSVPDSREERIDWAARACGLTDELVEVPELQLRLARRALRDSLLDRDGKPRRPVPPMEQACIWTAKTFGVTQQTVRNLLAPGGVTLSRK